MVLHGDPTNPSSPCCPVTRAQAAASGLADPALGHIHTQGQMEAGAPCAPGRAAPWAGALTKPGSKACTSVGFPLRAPKLPSGLWVGGAMRTSPFRQVRTLWPPFLPSCLRTPAGTYTASPSRESRSRWTWTDCKTRCPAAFSTCSSGTGRSLPGTCGRGRARIAWRGGIFRFCSRPLKNATGPEAEALCLAARISRRILEGQEVTLP